MSVINPNEIFLISRPPSASWRNMAAVPLNLQMKEAVGMPDDPSRNVNVLVVGIDNSLKSHFGNPLGPAKRACTHSLLVHPSLSLC